MAVPSRFNRNYELRVQVSETQLITVRPPIRLVFSADKSVAGALNRMTVRIYNLNETHRLALAKDAEDGLRIIRIELRVGYADTLQRVFLGTVYKGQNQREGTDLVTVIDSLDGGYDFLNTFTSTTVGPGADVIESILANLANTSRGKISNVPTLIRPKVLVGDTATLLDDAVGQGRWFIDDEKLYVLTDTEVVSLYAPVVSAETGMISTPTRQQFRITFDTLLNPTLRIGGLCDLRSKMAPQYNGVYRIDTISYDGDTHGASWTQTVTGYLSDEYTAV